MRRDLIIAFVMVLGLFVFVSYTVANAVITSNDTAFPLTFEGNGTDIVLNDTINVTESLNVVGQINGGFTGIYHCSTIPPEAIDYLVAAALLPGGQSATGSPTEFLNQIKCGRNIFWDTSEVGSGCAGNIDIWGLDMNGANLTETMAYTGTDTGTSNNAFSRVTRWRYDEDTGGGCSFVVINIGVETDIGLPNNITSANDVFKIVNSTQDIITIINGVDTTYNTVDLSTYLAGVHNEELTFYYKYGVVQT